MFHSIKQCQVRFGLIALLSLTACTDFFGGPSFHTGVSQGGSGSLIEQSAGAAGESSVEAGKATTTSGGSTVTTSTKSNGTGGAQNTSNAIGGMQNISTITGGAISITTIGTGGSTAICPSANLASIKLEADYIRRCQYLPAEKANEAYGAINHLIGDPTIVIPEEMAIAGIGLIEASKALNDTSYRDAAGLALDYLVRIQHKIYGGWHDQYNRTVVTNAALSLRQTSLIVIFMNEFGYRSSKAAAMKAAGGFILTHQSLNNKGGNDDGLVCVGRDKDANFISTRYVSDNASAYQALLAAAAWADIDSDTAAAKEFKDGAARILSGIKTQFLDPTKTHWKRVIDQNGKEPTETVATIDWISYSPALFDLPLEDVSLPAIGTWIHDNLQQANGSVVWNNSNYRARQSPLYSFEASKIWKKSGQCAYASSASNWSVSSGLWQKTADANAVTGGWIDWLETSGNQATQTERYIETSAFSILSQIDEFAFTP